jgi:hypothetical protein
MYLESVRSGKQRTVYLHNKLSKSYFSHMRITVELTGYSQALIRPFSYRMIETESEFANPLLAKPHFYWGACAVCYTTAKPSQPLLHCTKCHAIAYCSEVTLKLIRFFSIPYGIGGSTQGPITTVRILDRGPTSLTPIMSVKVETLLY